MKKKILISACIAMLAVNPISAYDTYSIPGYNFNYIFDVYNTDDKKIDLMGETLKSPFNITKNYMNPLFISAKNWSNIIRVQNNDKPIRYAVFSEDDYNASAASLPVDVAELPYKISYVNAVINNYKVLGPKDVVNVTPAPGLIMLGYGVDEDNPGWAPFSGFHSLYHGELSDLNVVLTHEFMHALGVTTSAMDYNEDSGDKTIYFSRGPKDSLSLYDVNLRVYTGDVTQPFDINREVVPANGMTVGKGKEFDMETYSPYFVGKNTIKVLSGKDDYDAGRQAIIDNGGFVNYSSAYSNEKRPNVFGLPIHPYDDMKEEGPDLSHFELRNSYMSHQAYRNWLIPMEAELAVLKDIGYNIDLRRFFGKSYYLNGVTDTFTSGYSKWNGTSYTGVPSEEIQGVGLHIYGDNNNITQASDILTTGEGSFGVRIDGEGNTYTLNGGNIISANGKDNLALAVTWGQNHKVNVEQGAVVEALANDGIAASFDFGSNMFGSLQDVKGSYINYDSTWGLNRDPDNSTQSALVDEFNVAGTLEGKKAAIYISDNAHVNNINILDGAKINGDIISEWNSVSSGKSAKVQTAVGSTWLYVNPAYESQIYFTNLNFDSGYTGTVKGVINGENGIYNTLKLNNAGDLTVTGEKIYVNRIDNTGALTVNDAEISTQKGNITGGGSINVNKSLRLFDNVKNIENAINLAANSELSIMNDNLQDVNINTIKADNAKISFDLGDKFVIENSSNQNTVSVGQVKYTEEMAKELDTAAGVYLFERGKEYLDLGTSEANVYYNGNKYTLTQDDTDKYILNVNKTASNVELKDAVEDSTAANYIVTEDKLTKDAGSVKGNYFEILGKDVNVNGHKGLVVDKNYNTKNTTLKTSIAGASDADVTVKNGGKLIVDTENKAIILGKKGETALKLKNGNVELNAAKNQIMVLGSIKGSDNKKDRVLSTGNVVTLSEVSDANVTTNNTLVTLAGTSKNTIWQNNSAFFSVGEDSYLASDGSNQFIHNGKIVNLKNNKASDITLAKMTLNKDLNTAIDVDLKNMTTDRFVFKNSSDLKTNSNLLYIDDVNLINAENVILSDEKYTIPFASKQYHNEEFIGGIVQEIKTRNLLTPIFKYKFGYEENEKMAGFVLTRGSSGDYNNYNPAIMTGPIAAQLGGYLSQLNSYDEAFRNLDMKMLLTREERKAFKMANRYASAEKPQVFSETYLPEKDSAGWFRPYASFEKVGLKNGPRVGNIMYGSYFGGDSDMYETKNGWDYQYSLYGSYNGSHQYYAGNSIYQNGGNLGATGIWYKGDFFTALTTNVGASVADASTMYGSEDIPMLMSGVASKTGFNWELAKGKFIIQPSYMMSYSFVNTFDYHNAAGVKINADPLHAINITPGIKFIGNLKHGWQPYMGVQMVWNIMDKTDFKAQSVSLPDMSVKPYVQYGVGLQKRWGERFTGFGQVVMRNGGRNGVALSAGFRWAIGKDKKQSKNKAEETKAPKTIKKMNSHNSPKARNIAKYKELISGS